MRGFRGVGFAGVLAELFEVGGQFALGLQQQGLWVAGQFARRQQLGVAEAIEVLKAGAHGLGQRRWQRGKLALECLQGAVGFAQAHRIAAGQVVFNVAGDLVLKVLRQAQVALHQQVRALQRLLRPP